MIEPEFEDEMPPARAPAWRSPLVIGLGALILVLLVVMIVQAGVDFLSFLLPLVFGSLIPALLGAWLGQRRPVTARGGFFLCLILGFLGYSLGGAGVLLGYLAALIVFAIPVREPSRRCPFCDERVRVKARVCPHCRREIV